jgi:hypothetical protein
MALPLVRALEPIDGARQQLRDGAERNPQDPGNLAIPQPVVPQMETLTLAIGQRVEHASQPMPTFPIHDAQLRVGVRVDYEDRRQQVVLDAREFPALPHAPFQSQIVSDTKQPALEIRSRAAPLQMPEQRKEDVLHDVLTIGRGDATGADVPKQRIAKPVEQDEDVLLESRVFENVRRPARDKCREPQR